MALEWSCMMGIPSIWVCFLLMRRLRYRLTRIICYWFCWGGNRRYKREPRAFEGNLIWRNDRVVNCDTIFADGTCMTSTLNPRYRSVGDIYPSSGMLDPVVLTGTGRYRLNVGVTSTRGTCNTSALARNGFSSPNRNVWAIKTSGICWQRLL